MSTQDVWNALDIRAKAAIAAVSATLPVEEENIDFQAPAAGHWASIAGAFRVSSQEEHTLGPGGTKLERGIYSITMVYPTNDGTDGARADIATLESYFPLAQTVTSNGQTVTVRGAFPPNTRIIDGTYRMTYSVEWEAIVPK